MKRGALLISTLVVLICVAGRIGAQTSFAVVKSSGSTTISSTFKDALTAATNGDIIYLPVGSIDMTGITINKGVHLIGVGYNPDTTGAVGTTLMAGNVVFVTGADGGSIEGVFIAGALMFGTSTANSEVHNFTISRCFIDGALYLSNGWNINTNGSNFTVSENIINYGVFGGQASNVLLSKNIIIQIEVLARPLTYLNGATISNNIIIPLDDYVCNYVTNTTFKNNIILLGNLGYVNTFTGNIYLNNLHCSSSGLNQNGVVTSTGNVYLSRDKILVNQSGGRFSFKHDYHLSAAALSAINGSDGTQVGLYGTANPFKDGGLPPNPAILQAKVSSKSNAKGKLDIEFKVQAQSK